MMAKPIKALELHYPTILFYNNDRLFNLFAA